MDLYRPNIVFGFHGCHKDIYEKVISGEIDLQPSDKKYHWLGNGVYFWEGSLERGKAWARQLYGDDGRVLGAVIDLGNCLDLTDSGSAEFLQMAYNRLKLQTEIAGEDMPINHGERKSDHTLLYRDLDCKVIETLHEWIKEENLDPFDSVRGAFYEGEEVYEGSGFYKQTHIQLAIRNPNCIRGYFIPREEDTNYRSV